MRYIHIILCSLLLGCTITTGNGVSQDEFDHLKKDVNWQYHYFMDGQNILIEGTKKRLDQLEYFIEHDKCFTTYAICLGEKKKDSKACWSSHEACVIAVYHQWKDHK